MIIQVIARESPWRPYGALPVVEDHMSGGFTNLQPMLLNTIGAKKHVHAAKIAQHRSLLSRVVIAKAAFTFISAEAHGNSVINEEIDL